MNATKYSFANNTKNKIKVLLNKIDTEDDDLKKAPDGFLKLEIMINGKPFPSKFNKKKYAEIAPTKESTGVGGSIIDSTVSDFNGHWSIKENNENSEFPVHNTFKFPIKYST